MNHAKNFGKRAMSLILAVMMVLAIFPMSVFAANVYNATETGRDTTKNQVRVIVENTTFTNGNEPWSGRLVDQWVEIDDDSTVMSCVVAALKANNFEQTGAENNYISEINGLAEFAGGGMSGWMGTLNDWFTNEGFDAFTFANGKLEDGDEIHIMYSCDYGADCGGTWDNTDKTVKAVSFSAGTLDKDFSPNTEEYILTVPEETTALTVTPTAANKNYQVRTSVGTTEYKRTASIPVADGTVITVKCGDPEWPSMNGKDDGAHTYTFVVVKENNAPKIKESVQNPLAADVYVNFPYELDLSEIFEGEDLTYKVSVDSGEYTEANEKYSYTPESAGEKVLKFKAVNGSDESEVYTVNLNVTAIALRTVTVNVAPKTVEVTFKKGDTALTSSEVEDKGAVKVGSYTYHQYVLTVPAGEYSYVGTESETKLGGEVFTVADKEDSQTLNLLRVNVRYNGASLNQEGDYTFTLKNGEKEVVYGTPYVASNIRYTPTLLIAGVAHTGTTTLAEKWEDEFYLTNNGTFSNTPSKTTGSAGSINLPISQYKIIRVTAPKDATTTFYKQDANYVVEPVTPDTSTDNGDTVTYQFKGTAAHSGLQFRSMKDGKVTQAGYLTDGKYVNVTFPDDHTPSSVTSTMDYDDNGVLLNVSAKNKLNLEVGDTFKLRAFRAAWEIINTTTGNQMIEPDFHCQILSGNDVISIVPTEEATNAKFPNETNGNATGNWMNIKAEKTGTAIVAVYYDAIDVYGANPPAADAFSTFGATRDDRYGIFVVTVGENENITWNPVSQDGDWDAEFDTVYYVGENGVFTFKPTESVNSVTVRNVHGTDLGTAQTVTAESDGSYKVPVTKGANIVAVETANGTDYQIVRAKKINYYIKNNTTGGEATNGAPAIKTGDSVTISFDKLDMPIPKMSGVYNPGYMGTAKTAYMLNGSALLTSAGTQYDFSTKNSISFTAHFAGTNSLKGYISLSSMGDPFGNHRNINDDGKPVNTNAGENFGSFGSLPDISFEVTDSGESASYPDAIKLESLSVIGGLSAYNLAFNWKDLKDDNINWSKTTEQMKDFSLMAKVTAKDYNNTLKLRYWYDGEEVKSINLNSGITATVPDDFKLKADKILNLQVVVTPLDKDLGPEKTYTYIVYPGSTNLQYVHPVIKSLTAKAGGKPLTISPAFDTANLSYTLDVKCNDKITLNAEQLIKIYNTAVTADKSDKVVLTKLNKKEEAIGESITVFEAGQPNNPNRYWKLENLDITGVDTLQIKVTSYVDETIERTYKIKIKADYKGILNDTLAQLTETVKEPSFGTGGGEWTVLALARSEYFDELKNDYFKGYYEKVKTKVVELADKFKANNLTNALDKNKSTENSRVIIALSAIGKDPRNVGGINVLGAYDANGFDWIKKQGINGPIFALIALDTKNYATTDTTIRQQCIDFILSKELAGGGWALSVTAADPDITSMALQALAKYKDNKDVAAAAKRAFTALSDMQKDNGGFASWGSVNSESIAQVITACCAWGIDPDTDPRFVKNGVSAVDALLDYYVEEGKGFAHVLTSGGGYIGGEVNGMATDQAAYALVAFDRYKNKKTSLYDMSDVEFVDKVSETIEAVEVEKDKPFEYSVETTGNDTNEAKITIPATVAGSLKDASSMELKTDMGAIVFDNDALKAIFGGNKNVEIAMSTNESTDGSIILELTATDSEGNNLFNGQNGGKATVNVKVAAPEGKENYFVYYVNGDKYEKVKAELNGNGELVVELTHFSEYKIMKFILGDVDGEDGVNSLDAMYAYAYFNNPSIIGTDLNLFAADVDGDGEIDSYDAFLIYAYHNGLITSFEEG